MYSHINLDSFHNHLGKANYPLKQTACTAENPKIPHYQKTWDLSQHQNGSGTSTHEQKPPKLRSTPGKPFFHARFKKCFSKTLLSCLLTSHKWWGDPKGTDLPVVLQEHVAPGGWVNEELMNETQFLLLNPHSISTHNCTTQSSSVRSETGNSTLPSWEMTNNLGFEAHFGLLRSHQFEALL